MQKPFIAVGVLLAACASIRVVSSSKTGGEIALIGSRESAMDKARDEMARTCGGATAYEIVEEGEVGFQADAATATDPKEWRVHYECKGATPASAPVGDASPISRGPHAVIVRF